MDPNDFTTIENFVKGMVQLSEKLKKFDPGYLIAPMIGAVPFVDILNIIDDGFPNEKVYYVPASNKIKNVKKVIRNWFDNFLAEVYETSNTIRIASIDEVISGNSLIRTYKQAKAAINDKATQEMSKYLWGCFNEKEIRAALLDDEEKQKLRESIANQIVYFPFGVKETNPRRAAKNLATREYQKLLEERKTDVTEVSCIVTMDREDFFPITYKRVPIQNGEPVFYYPLIESFHVSPAYINFLKTVANIVGKNPEEVTLKNMGRILDSKKYLSKECQEDY